MVQRNLASIASFLAQTKLFGALSLNHLMVLAAGAGHYQCAAGETIFSKGEEGDTVFVIESGSAQILLPQENAADRLLATLKPGDIFGELTLFDTEPRSATAMATEAFTATTIRRSDFIAFLRKEPDAAIRILSVMAARIRQTDLLLGTPAAAHDLPVKIAGLLLELAKPLAGLPEGGLTPPLAVSRSQVHRSIDASKALVDLYIQLMEQQGIVSSNKDRIVVVQKSALEELASA